VSAGGEPPLGDDEAVVLDLRRRHGEGPRIWGGFGHGGIPSTRRDDAIAPHPGMKKPRADLGAGLNVSVHYRELVPSALGDDVLGRPGRDDRRAIEVRRELNDDRVETASDPNRQHRRPLTIGVNDVKRVAGDRNPDDRVVAVNDGSR
jgi:hypothetical protein